MRFVRLLAASAALVCSVSGHAIAAVYVITTTGNVTEATDADGLFGDGDLMGAAYEAVFRVTDPTPGAYRFDDGSRYYLEGGSFNGTPSPISASIKINGVTRSISGNFGSSIEKKTNYDSAGGNWMSLYVEEENLSYPGWYSAWIEHGFLSPSLIQSWPGQGHTFEYDLSAAAYRIGQVTFAAEISQNVTHAIFEADRVTIASVPEPSTWALLILGFGVVGAALRRRRAMVSARV